MLGSRFYFIITDEIIPPKQVQRYIKLILTTDSEKKYAKSMKAKKEDVDSIKVDTRIGELTPDSIKKMKKPSMAKLFKIKSLNNTEFKKVLDGNDAPYKELLETEAKVNKDEKEKEILDKKPDGMDKETYRKHLKDGIYDVLKKYHASTERETQLSMKVKDLEREVESLERMYDKKLQVLAKTENPFARTEEEEVETEAA
ncbi:MAG: hypothetical protein KZQ70_14115 [gamma proteobacterium symbiont of Lucinoma myriamae]|nr:hypothetical protein [gamma proteobacterium symbiont of Lucinoma myriamae]